MWLVWTGGNDRFWDGMSRPTLGGFDLLKIVAPDPKGENRRGAVPARPCQRAVLRTDRATRTATRSVGVARTCARRVRARSLRQ